MSVMKSLKKTRVCNGVYWVEAAAAGLRILCGCPADSVKHLKKQGLIRDEKVNGIEVQTGPNAILLSDGLIQNGQFANLAEFPVMQMLYFQGMMLPNHPNNSGAKPLLIGSKKQVETQKEYIYRGNYGLDSIEELRETGLSETDAKTQMRIKLKFAFGKIKSTNDLVDTLIISQKPQEIKNGVFIQRIGFNHYEITWGDDKIHVDLNLAPDESYIPSYSLEFQQIERNYFSVIHSGEGDGWNPEKPCMGSIVIYQGKIYLIDAGPHISHTLSALGIGVNEIEGVFHTHAHDDHFTGFPALLNARHRIKYFATPSVRASVTKKLCALMSIREEKFTQYFEIHDLEYDQWQNFNGLEVKPVYSPHPVETSIFFFRVWRHGIYHSFAHFADIASLDILQGMVTGNENEPGLSEETYEKTRNDYLTAVDLKKIDAGGGMIHGNAKDFAQDSSKLIYSHLTGNPANEADLSESIAQFGQEDVLISEKSDFLKKKVHRYIEQIFPQINPEKAKVFWQCPIVSFEPGVILLEADRLNTYIYLILTGTVVYQTKTGRTGLISTGNLIGETPVYKKSPSQAVYRAQCVIQALQIPAEIYQEFIKNNKIFENSTPAGTEKITLRNTLPFDDVGIDKSILKKISKHVSIENYKKGMPIPGPEEHSDDLFILKEGEAELCFKGIRVHKLLPGDFFGEEPLVYGSKTRFAASATESCRIYRIPGGILQKIPIIHWHLLSLSTDRMSKFQISFPDLPNLF
ncbi:MAG: cyclic nucleotide-binding domain-containing protein [SAR324 cluster bacterium]|nr:cyclic nucleotide-binding domain-containing protein [SAR324 cluster bacterium]